MSNDDGISKELFISRVHEPAATKVFAEELAPGMTVVDAGGNIGYYTLLEAQVVGPTGHVVAVEPSPQNYELLQENTQGLPQVDLLRCAVGSEVGSGALVLSPKGSNWHRLAREGEDVTEVESVSTPITTLDKLTEPLERVDFVRMDIEGHELAALQGASRLLREDHPQLMVEMHLRKRRRRAFLQLLQERGYVPRAIVDRPVDSIYKLRGDRDSAITYHPKWRALDRRRPYIAFFR